MKYLVTLLFCTSFCLAQAQWWGSGERIEGNGVMTKETRNLGAYTAVSSSGSFHVVLQFGKPGELTIEGEENLLPYLETKVENNVLKLQYRKNLNIVRMKKVTVYVPISRIEGIYLSGSGNIEGNGDFGNEGNTLCRLSGSGNIRLSFDRIQNIKAEISGSGSIQLKGKAEEAGLGISGSGDIDCLALETRRTKININGSGNAKVWANQALDVNISGSGDVTYQGTATDVVKRISGSGRVKRLS
jgi:hypothetical protein